MIFPIWHKTHFKMKYLYSALLMCLLLGIGLNAAYVIPTSKVCFTYENCSFLQLKSCIVATKKKLCICLLVVPKMRKLRFSLVISRNKKDICDRGKYDIREQTISGLPHSSLLTEKVGLFREI